MESSAPMVGRYTRWSSVVAVLAPLCLVLAVGLIYGQSLTHELVWDDEDNIVNNPALRQSPLAGGFLASPAAPTRFITNLSFAIEYRVWGLHPTGYHVTNLLLHLANVLLVYLLARRFAALAPADGRRVPWVPWLSGFIFAVHPVHVETVNSIALGRGYLLATFFGLVSLLNITSLIQRGHIHHQAHGDGGATVDETVWHSWSGWRWMAAVVALLGSILSHEIGLVIIALIAVLWLNRKVLRLSRLRPGLVGNALFIAAAALLVASMLWVGVGHAAGALFNQWLAALTLLTKQLVAPVPLCIWYADTAVDSPRFVPSWTVIVMLFALGLAGLTYMRRIPAVTLSFYMLLIALSPLLLRQVVPSPPPSVFGERWLYLPSAFFSLWIGSLAGLVSHNRAGGRLTARLATIVPAGLLILLGLITTVYAVSETGQWRSDIRLFQHAVRHCPPSAYLHAALGKHYYDEDEIEQARQEFLAAVAIDSGFHRARIGLGLVALDRGDVRAALHEFSIAVRQAPSDADAHNGLGEVYFRLKRHDEAVREFERAIALRPSLSAPHWNLAVTFMKLDRIKEAVAEWERVVAVSPDPEERNTALEEINLLKRALAEQNP